MIARTPLTVTAAVVGAAMIGICSAHADTSAFPDLSRYTPVKVQDYEIDTSIPGAPPKQIVFITPDDIECDFNAGSAVCTGSNFPGLPPQQVNSGIGNVVINSISTSSGLSVTDGASLPDNIFHGAPIKVLPPFHSITVDGVLCGVDNSRTTACIDPQGRGFVLSRRGSGSLPHV